jgi:hypothetical protein
VKAEVKGRGPLYSEEVKAIKFFSALLVSTACRKRASIVKLITRPLAAGGTDISRTLVANRNSIAILNRVIEKGVLR